MCTRYNLTSPREEVKRHFRLDDLEPFPPRYNIAPRQPVGIVRIGLSGAREFALVQWGLLPGWVKDPPTFAPLLNARAETLLDKASFRAAVRYRRCLVPANGYYEWSGPRGAKRPHLVQAKAGALLAFGGLWEHWLGADGSEIETMAVVTVPANALVGPLHDRMPAILDPASHDAWLDCRDVRPEVAVTLLQPAPEGSCEVVEIGQDISSVRAEGAQLITPVTRRTLL